MLCHHFSSREEHISFWIIRKKCYIMFLQTYPSNLPHLAGPEYSPLIKNNTLSATIGLYKHSLLRHFHASGCYLYFLSPLSQWFLLAFLMFFPLSFFLSFSLCLSPHFYLSFSLFISLLILLLLDFWLNGLISVVDLHID